MMGSTTKMKGKSDSYIRIIKLMHVHTKAIYMTWVIQLIQRSKLSGENLYFMDITNLLYMYMVD